MGGDSQRLRTAVGGDSQRLQIVVVGAGISGLAYAHALGEDDSLLVVDGASRAGGLICTREHDGLHFECGPEALQDDAAETLALLAELGLPPQPADAAAARRLVLDEHGRLQPVPTGPLAFLASPLLSWRGKLRALREPWRPRGVALDGSLADFVRHRLGPEVLARLVDPAVSGIFASDPELLSLRAAFPRLAALAANHGSLLAGLKAKSKARRAAGEPRRVPSLLSFPGGLEDLPRALAAALGQRLRLSWPVATVRPEGEGWVVRGAAGELHAQRVVLALPVAATAALLAEGIPALSQELRSMTAETVVSVAHVWPRAAVGQRLEAFGYLVPSSLGRRHLGTLFSSSILPRRCPRERVLLRTLLGGVRHPELAELGDGELTALVLREVGPVLGLSGNSPDFVHVSRWRSVLPRYDLQQPARQDRIDALLSRRPGLHLLGNHRRGIAVNALIEAARSLAREHRQAGPARGSSRSLGDGRDVTLHA